MYYRHKPIQESITTKLINSHYIRPYCRLNPIPSTTISHKPILGSAI